MPGVMPKKKHSRRRVKGRWAHKSLTPAGRATCPRCHAVRLPHRVCTACGYYNGREVVPAEDIAE